MIKDIYESDSRIDNNYENDEDFNEEVLDQSFDKNDVNITFFDNQKDNNSMNDEITNKELYFVGETKDEKNSFTENTNNSGHSGNSLTKTKTKTKTTNKIKIQKKCKNTPTISDKIFNISKVNKKLGRIGKTKKNIKGKHNKCCEDNIIQKIKASFQEKIFNHINKKYEEYLITNHIGNKPQLIKRISPVESKKIKKDDNLLWFSLKLKDLFSIELSSKYTKYGKNYNKNNIDILYKENKAKDVIDILEKTVREKFNEFCNDTPIEGFETLKYDLDYQKKKMEEENEDNIEEYLKKYKEIAQNLEQIFLSKKARGIKKQRE